MIDFKDLYAELLAEHQAASGRILPVAIIRAAEQGRWADAVMGLRDLETQHHLLHNTVVRELAALAAGGADQVAGRLAARGIKGEPGNADCCPIALFVGGLDGIERADCFETRVCVVCASGRIFSVSLPAEIQGFVTRFDQGRYPHLIDDPAGVIA